MKRIKDILKVIIVFPIFLFFVVLIIIGELVPEWIKDEIIRFLNPE